MTLKQVVAIYDFVAEPGTGEISITTGEVLTVTRTDVGEGWWEGHRTSGGECGLFPEAYVEDYVEDVGGGGPPAMAPPPLPQDYDSAPSNTFGTTSNLAQPQPADDWAADPWSAVSQPTQPPQQQQEWNQEDDWDSDFDDESASQVGHNQGHASSAGKTGGDSHMSSSLAVPAASSYGNRGSTSDLSGVGRKGPSSSKSSFNRFSVFVKSGSENYLLGKVKESIPEADALTVIDNGNGKFSWENNRSPFSCVIASPKKEAKFKGLKSYIAYQLTPSFNNIQVSRRYKHFDWLHERLVAKYHFVPIPPLPDKQIQGRYEEEFIEHRMNQLQSFVDRMCRHPVLSQSEVWNHFLSCTDEKRWKGGKRKAEKDPLVGGAAYAAITVPETPLEQEFVDREVQIFSQFHTQFDVAVKNLAKTAADQTTKCQNHFKREFQQVGKAFIQLGQAMDGDGGSYNPGLNNAVVSTGECYEDIGKLYEEQPRLDWEHLADMMHDYKGLLSGWPQVLQIQQGSQGKRREVESDSKVGEDEVSGVMRRSDTVSYALLAEVNTFHEQRVKDMKSAHQAFLREQISFYQKITEKLQECVRLYDQC